MTKIAATGLVPLLQVYDMPTALAFYAETLGFSVFDASPAVTTPEGRFSHWMWLRNGPADLMLNTAFDAGERPPARDPVRQAAHGDICLYIGCADVDAVFAALNERFGGLAAPINTPHGMRQLELRDPDGYAVYLTSPM